MSTLKLENIKHENSSTNNMVMDSDGSTRTTGTLKVNDRLQVGDASITNAYGGNASLGYVADFQGSSGNQTYISIAAPNASSLGDNGVVIGEDATDTYFTQRGNKNIHLAANGATRLKISGDGHVTKPYQPAFKAFSTPYGWTTFGGTGNVLMPFNAVQHNVGNHYSTSNYRFTAPVDGVYYFYGQWYSDGNTFGEMLIRQNGSAEKAFARNNSQSVTVQCATTLSLSANDYIEMMGKISNSDASDWYSYNSYSFFCGYLVG